jgi:hypothetical protein
VTLVTPGPESSENLRQNNGYLRKYEFSSKSSDYGSQQFPVQQTAQAVHRNVSYSQADRNIDYNSVGTKKKDKPDENLFHFFLLVMVGKFTCLSHAGKKSVFLIKSRVPMFVILTHNLAGYKFKPCLPPE